MRVRVSNGNAPETGKPERATRSINTSEACACAITEATLKAAIVMKRSEPSINISVCA